MKILKSPGEPRIAVVGIMHGEEIFGIRVLKHYETRLKGLEGVLLVFVNEEACTRGVRFLDRDINDCFPGHPEGCHEERLAAELLKETRDVPYVIDIHTTREPVGMIPIIANTGLETCAILNLTNRTDIALMSGSFITETLIGNVRGGVALEFGAEYAKTDAAFAEIVSVIDGLIATRTRQPLTRRVYDFSEHIPAGTKLPKGARNFKFIPGIGYPFIFASRDGRKDDGYAAKTCENVLI